MKMLQACLGIFHGLLIAQDSAGNAEKFDLLSTIKKGLGTSTTTFRSLATRVWILGLTYFLKMFCLPSVLHPFSVLDSSSSRYNNNIFPLNNDKYF